MTMPHLMNCGHKNDGWCLECVRELWDEKEVYRLNAEHFESERDRWKTHTEAAKRITWASWCRAIEHSMQVEGDG